MINLVVILCFSKLSLDVAWDSTNFAFVAVAHSRTTQLVALAPVVLYLVPRPTATTLFRSLLTIYISVVSSWIWFFFIFSWNVGSMLILGFGLAWVLAATQHTGVASAFLVSTVTAVGTGDHSNHTEPWAFSNNPLEDYSALDRATAGATTQPELLVHFPLKIKSHFNCLIFL